MAEPDNSFASNAVPEVQNKTSKPPGILPKNAQTWIVLGVAVLMILVISFSNAGAPKQKPRDEANRQNEEQEPTHGLRLAGVQHVRGADQLRRHDAPDVTRPAGHQ